VQEVALREPLAGNSFVGLNPPLKGTRAWPLAPPTIPHSTLMRSDCLSCHGPQGLYGLRTPHPERQSCVQCHVPGAELDQHRFLSAGPTP
jgi:cytochrome c-type protein NapB